MDGRREKERTGGGGRGRERRKKGGREGEGWRETNRHGWTKEEREER